MAKPFDYKRTAGLYNRFLAEDGNDILSSKDILLYDAIRNPGPGGRSGTVFAELLDARSQLGRQFDKDARLTESLLNEVGMEGISEADSLKLVEALSPVGRKIYENFYRGTSEYKAHSPIENKIMDGFLQQDSKYNMGE